MGKAAERLEHVCRECGFRTVKWFGKCAGCGAFGSVSQEERRPLRTVSAVVPIDQVPLETGRRDRTGIGELDRALGGGLVPGAVVLLAGDPGIGKSTLLLSALDRLSRPQRPVLYVSGEESLQQIRLRGERLGTLSPALHLAAETDAETVLEHARNLRPRALAVDSIQTMSLRGLESACGSVTQVREVGVDTVLFFEGDRSHAYRVLRAQKNRFGSTNEIGVFEMKSEGLVEVANPSAFFLAERPRDASGSAVSACINGSRPLLVEVQALVADSASLGSPRRTAIGVDGARVALLTAVLERKEGMVFSDQDIYVSVAGGASLSEPAGDLAVAAALMSSLRDLRIAHATVVLGEVGLAGEVRAVGQIEQRLAEAAQLGFTRCVLREGNRARTRAAPLELCGVSTVGEAMETLFS